MAFYKKLEQYVEQESIHHFEGEQGIRNLEKVAKAIGYYNGRESSLRLFLSDNPGAIEAIVEWIGKQRVPEWERKLDSLLIPADDETDGESYLY